MYSRTVLLSEAGYKSDVVEDDHFEANAIYTRDYLDPGGPFDRMFADMGWSGLRFPGGTVTEENFAPGSGIVERLFDVSRPSGLSDDGAPRIVTTPAMFSYAIDKGIAVDFTLPTDNYFSDETDEDGFRIPSTFGLYRILDRVDEMVRGDYGHAFIEKFEIGNEFWYKNERQTPEEYGHIVEHLASGMQSLFDLYQAEQADDSAWVMPEISVQSAPGWRPQGNEAIFDQLSLSSRAAIDAVSTHYYPSSYTVATDRQVHFDRLDDWQKLEGVDKELSYYVSEWNMATSTETDTGLAQASGMLETMRVMLERGIDHAAIWGTQYYNLRTRLAELENDPDAPGGKDYSLTPAGEIYRMMSSSIRGLRVLDLDTDSSLRDALEALADDDASNFYVPDRVAGLHTVLGANPSVIPTDTVLQSEGFRQLMQNARALFDVVILDTPPLMPVVDARYLAAMTDICLFCVRAGSTDQRPIREAFQELPDSHWAIMSVLMGGESRKESYSGKYNWAA